MKVLVYNRQKDVPLHATSAKSVAREILKNENSSTDELAIYFVSTEEICNLHRDFFNDPSPTDCISFPLDNIKDQASGYHILGEIFICPKAALDIDADSVYAEVTLYLVHGILHLLGYDDIEEKARKKMRKAEEKHMELLAIKKILLKAP
jgi:probable rRNA maturation factor